jgi:putative ABC transport system substrate-binding protein
MKLKKSGFKALLLLLLFLPGLCLAKEPVISVLLSSDMEFYKEVSAGLKTFYADKGVGVRLTEYSLKGQDPAAIFSKINAEKPDLMLTVGEDALKAAKDNIKGVPIVFTMVFNSKAMMDDNTTGILLDISPEMKITGVKKVLPRTKTIGLLYSPNSLASFEDIKAECDRRGITLNSKLVSDDAGFTGALSAVFSGSDCFIVILDPKIYFSQTLKFLLLESIKQKVPVIGLSSFYTKAGAIASFDCDYKDLGKQAGEIASRIIAGEKPSTIKPVRPRKYKFSINLVTAEKDGIVIPPDVVKEAAEVFDK